MPDFIARRAADIEWVERRHVVVDGERQSLVMSKLYLDPTKDPALVRRVEYKPGYSEPRHRHTVDEIVYILAGEVDIGGEVYREGDTLWIGANTEYGPLKAGPAGMTFLLIRNAPAKYIGPRPNATP